MELSQNSEAILSDNHREILDFWAFEYGAEGIEEENESFPLKIYFPDAQAAQNFLDWLQAEMPQVNWAQLDLQNLKWQEQWKEFLSPILLEDKIWIYPASEKQPEKKAKDQITLEPDLVFGSGHHPTTRLVAKALLKMEPLNGKKILDVGCGTGILSFVAKHEQAEFCLGFDIDGAAQKNLVRNMQYNSHIAKPHFFVGEISALKAKEIFDVCMVNMIRRDSFGLLSHVYRASARSGKLILSGFLKEENRLGIEHCQNLGYEFTQDYILEDWWCGVFTKNKAHFKPQDSGIK